jgi:hypothetical protein
MLECCFDAVASRCFIWMPIMRTTLALSEDVVQIARQCAAREGISLGEAVSRLVRDGFRARMQQPATASEPRSRYTVLPARDEIVTSEHVRRLMDEEGI